MANDRVFVQDINNYLEDDKSCNGIIIPNQFNLYKSETNKVIGKFGNKSLIITEQILQDFTIVGKYVWEVLSNNRKLANYDIIGYIAKHIKYNSNIIKLNSERLRGYTGVELSNRDYTTAIATLKRYNIIGDCNIKGCFAVNPIAIFKGSIYKFVELYEENKMDCYINEDNKVIVDKAIIIKDKKCSKFDIIYNREYHKNIDKLNTLTYKFA